MSARTMSVVLGGLLVVVLSASPCGAQGNPAQTGAAPAAPGGGVQGGPGGKERFVRETRGQLGASINNLGLQLSFDTSWRRALSASKNPLLSDAHVSFGGTAAFTPAHVRGGGWVEFAPVSIFAVRAGAEPAYYFGTFNSLSSFDNRTDVFDTDTRKARGGAVSGTATRLYVTPSLQFRAGHIVGRTSMDFERWSSNAPGPFFYEPSRDTLLEASGDRLISFSSAVLYERTLGAGSRMLTGLTHSLTRIDGSSVNQIQKIGAVFIRQSGGRVLRLPKPSLTLAVSRYIDDPSKRNQWTAAMAIGFAISR